jgi:hypothetical protein
MLFSYRVAFSRADDSNAIAALCVDHHEQPGLCGRSIGSVSGFMFRVICVRKSQGETIAKKRSQLRQTIRHVSVNWPPLCGSPIQN